MTENLLETASERPIEEPTPIEGESRRLTRRQLIVRRFVRNRTAVVGLFVTRGADHHCADRSLPHQLDL